MSSRKNRDNGTRAINVCHGTPVLAAKNSTADTAVMLHNLQERLFSAMRWMIPCNISRCDWTAGVPKSKVTTDQLL